MLRPVLLVSALIALAGAEQVYFVSSVVDISSCPITFYGQKYEQVYLNLTDGHFAVCFDGFFENATSGECIVGPPVQHINFDIAEDSYLKTSVNIPSIHTELKCHVEFYMQYQNYQGVYLFLIDYGNQAGAYVYTDFDVTVELDFFINGTKFITMPQNTVEDISGCRHSGNVYTPGTLVSSNPETCSNLTCSKTAVLQTSDCGPLKHCHGSDICIFDATCTVTGPTVIDIHGQVNSIQDRCAYSLVSIPSVPDFHVLAKFQERRRKDVSFLDSVTLRLDGPGVQIHLEQGGRVRLDDSELTLNSSPQLVHGVEFSKDQTGVTASVSLSNSTAQIFFDGYTAQIHLEGYAVSSPEGLCANSNQSLSELRLTEYSSSSCETQYNDTADSTIDCNSVTERCNLLKDAPFTSCNQDIDPKPYITACTDTLCKYPGLDGLNCQFLEAYAKACSWHKEDTLAGWRSTAGCSSEAFCQDRTCSDHEFCGKKPDGIDTRCFCRAIFASKYTSKNALGDPTVCQQNSASLTLVNCLLEDNHIDYSELHLNDPACRGQMNELTHMVTFSFNSSNSCGTVVMANNSHIIYKNSVRNQNISSDIITRKDDVFIDFSCSQIQQAIDTAAFKIKDCSILQQITSGVWNYSLIMNVYTNADRTQIVGSLTDVRLSQKLWVELKTQGLDGQMVAVVTDSCWATSEPSPNGTLRHDLIINGCANAADKTVKVEENGLGTSNYFSFEMFKFTGTTGDVYLHCKLHLCTKQNNNCIPTCDGAARRRRSVGPEYEGEAPAVITIAWST